MSTVGVVIATFGDRRIWDKFAQRAKESAENQTRSADRIISYHVDIPHSDGLSIARNRAASKMETDWVIFLDADDTLDSQYIEKMLEGEGDVRQPATIGVYEDGRRDAEAVVIPKKPLIDGNYIVIGAMMKRNLFLEVGGFRDWPLYEDWDLYLRMEETGATFGVCPEAIYEVFVKENTRNMPARVIQERYYAVIRKEAMKRRGLI
jgi:glycosyltransferase involved in cell wall biosynthesis